MVPSSLLHLPHDKEAAIPAKPNESEHRLPAFDSTTTKEAAALGSFRIQWQSLPNAHAVCRIQSSHWESLCGRFHHHGETGSSDKVLINLKPLLLILSQKNTLVKYYVNWLATVAVDTVLATVDTSYSS